MIQGLDSFNRYGSAADLARTAACPISWAAPVTSLVSFVGPPPTGSGQCVQVGGNQTGQTQPAQLCGKFSVSDASLIIGFGLKLGVDTNNSVCKVQLTDFTTEETTTGTTQATIEFDQATGILTVFDSTGTSVFSEGGQFNITGWNYINVQMTVGSTTGALTLNIGSTTVATLTGINTQGDADTTWNGVIFTVPEVSGTVKGLAQISDFIVQDTTAPVNGIIRTGVPLGPIYIAALYPRADGAVEWTPATSEANYLEVNDRQCNNGATSNSVTQSFTSTFSDLYLLDALAVETGVVAGVQVTGLYSNLGTTVASIEHSMLSTGNAGVIGDVSLPASASSYDYYSTISEINQADDLPWQVSDFIGIQFGPSVQTNPHSGVVSTGEPIVSASGTIAAGLGGGQETITGTFATTSGITFSGFMTMQFVSYPLGPVGGTPSISVGNLQNNFAYTATLDTYDVPSGTTAGSSVNFKVITRFTDAPSGDGTCTVTGVFQVGSSVTVNFSGFAQPNAIIEVSGNPGVTGQAYTEGTCNSNSYAALGMGSGSSLENLFGNYLINNDIGTLTYGLTIYAGASAPAQIVKCSQFFVEAVTFASSFEGSGGGELTIPIFPTLAGLAYPVLRRFLFSNVVSTGASLAEVRIGYSPYPLWEWELEFTYLPDELANGTTASDYKTLVGFCLLVQGNLLPFLYLDQDDNYGTNMPLATTDGVTNAFTLYRTYGVGENVGTEPIGYINGAVQANVYLNGEIQNPETYTLVNTTPLNQQVVFNSAPASGQALTWDGGYYFYCRLGEEKQDFNKTMQKLWDTDKLVIRSLRQA